MSYERDISKDRAITWSSMEANAQTGAMNRYRWPQRLVESNPITMEG